MNKTAKGMDIIVETMDGSSAKFVPFSRMPNDILVTFVEDFHWALVEWMGRLRDMEDEFEKNPKNDTEG